MISGGRPDSVGGGVVAEVFRDRRKPGRFSGGRGGVVAEIFRDRRKPGTFSGGGGGSSRIFFTSPITISHPDSVGGDFWGYFLTGGQDKSNYLNSGHFFDISGSPRDYPKLIAEKQNLTKVWGGPWPPWPPLATPLD